MSVIDIIRHTVEQFVGPVRNLGNVIVVPGIFGSDLVDRQAGHLWLIPPRLDELLLKADGKTETRWIALWK